MKGFPFHLCGKRDRGGTGGFLLTETLATFTISAFVLLGLVSASSVLLRAVDRNVANVQDVDELVSTLNAVERDVSSLARARWNGYEPQPFVFRGGPNSLYFAHAQRDAAGSSETSVIALREIANGSGTRLMRGEARLSVRAAGFDKLRYGPQRELGTGLARLRFYYVPPVAAKTGQARVRTWPVGPMLPVAVVVEAIERDTGRLIASKHIPIRANADIGCLEQDNADSKILSPGAAALAALNTPITNAGAAPPPTTPTPATSGTAAGGSGADAAQASFCGRAGGEKPKDGQRDAATAPSLRQLPPTGSTL